MSSVDTSFMRMIRTFCNNTNPGAGFGGTKRKASNFTGFGLTPVFISKSLYWSNLVKV